MEVADGNDVGNVVLWEGDIRKLEGVLYQLNRFKVQSFIGKNFQCHHVKDSLKWLKTLGQ